MANNFFMKGLKSGYAALPVKNETTIYFCTDTQEMFVGNDLYTEPVRFYTGSLPSTPATGVLYVDTSTGTGHMHNGDTWATIFKAVVTQIVESASDDEIPTTKAVKTYVDGKINKTNDDLNDFYARLASVESAITWRTF